MATISFLTNKSVADTYHFTWNDLATGDVGQSVIIPQCPDKTVSFTGTFGGATVVLKGCNDLETETDWFTLKDIDGNDISLTAAAMVVVEQNPVRIRPEVTGGTGVAIDVKVSVPNKAL